MLINSLMLIDTICMVAFVAMVFTYNIHVCNLHSAICNLHLVSMLVGHINELANVNTSNCIRLEGVPYKYTNEVVNIHVCSLHKKRLYWQIY